MLYLKRFVVLEIFYSRFIVLLFKASLKCDFGGHCEINVNNRHVCSACRLRKCFTSGMKIEMLRSAPDRNGPIIKRRTQASKMLQSLNYKRRVKTFYHQNSNFLFYSDFQIDFNAKYFGKK